MSGSARRWISARCSRPIPRWAARQRANRSPWSHSTSCVPLAAAMPNSPRARQTACRPLRPPLAGPHPAMRSKPGPATPLPPVGDAASDPATSRRILFSPSSQYQTGGREPNAGEQPAVMGGVPVRNPNFTGREQLLLDLRAQLSMRASVLLPQALHGLGGVGKTQVAVEYVHRFATDYELVWWISAEQTPLIRSSLTELGARLGIAAEDDATRT